jgi:mannan endo-1,4-beta-mannosidase
MSAQYNSLIDLGKDTKLIAAAEVGSVPLPAQLQAYEADWVWFCTWGDQFINNAEYNPVDALKAVRLSLPPVKIFGHKLTHIDL